MSAGDAGQRLADDIDRAIYWLQQVGATAQLMADGAYHRLGAFDPLPNALDHLNDCIQDELVGLRNAHDAFEAATIRRKRWPICGGRTRTGTGNTKTKKLRHVTQLCPPLASAPRKPPAGPPFSGDETL